MSYLTDLLNMEVGSLSIFKSDEEKKKEYEDNIARNVQAMEMENAKRIADRKTFVGKPSPLYDTTDTVYLSDLGGKYYTDSGPFTRPGVLFSSLSPEEQNKALMDTKQVADSRNQMSKIIPGIEKGTIINPTLLQPDARQAYLEEAGKVFSTTQQDKLASAQRTMMQQMSTNENLNPSKEVKDYLSVLGGGDTKAVAEATKGISPNTLMTLLSAFQTDKPTPPPLTKIPTATKGVLQDYEDPYERYRRQGGIL